MLEIGSVIDGKYKILNEIDRGGMSIVYLAMNERANKQWAIKEVRKSVEQDFEVVRQSLVKETEILKELNHPHLPSIIDVIDLEGSFLIVMDYIEGHDLEKKLEEEEVQPEELVIDWAKQICEVLGYLHAQNPPIIYRDMKPGNVMLKTDGNIMLVDFGTAKKFKNKNVEDTVCLGTKGYAAPEQYGGQGATDARTDIYCLGSTLYHLVTNHNPALPPYKKSPIREKNPALSMGLEMIIEKCTKEDPDERYQSCAELMYDLEHYTILDADYRKKQKRKIRMFIGSVCLTLLAGGMAIFSQVKISQIKSGGYEELLTAAEEDLSKKNNHDAVDKYTQAINLNPTDASAYFSLVEVLTEDNVLTVTSTQNSKSEDELLQNALMGENAASNLATLEKADRAEYIKLCYELGQAYWFYYEESASRMSRASLYFKIVSKEDLSKLSFLEEQDKNNAGSWQKRAAIFYKIAEGEVKLGNATNDPTGKESYSYKDYLQDILSLMKAYDSEINDLDSQDKVALLRLYKDTAVKIGNGSDIRSFKTAGVGKDELVSLINTIEQSTKKVKDSLTETSQNTTIAELCETMEKYLTNARDMIESTYQTGKEEGEISE